MKSRVAVAILLFVVVAIGPEIAFCDELITTAQANTSGEDHSFRQAVSFGDDLIFEDEHSGPPADIAFNIPLTYSIPSGFTLSSAVLEFSIAGAISTNISGFSLPADESGGNFTPATMTPIVANLGPQIVVYVGDQSFLLMTDVTNGSTSVDLFALGYADLLRQGAPVTICGSVTLFSFVEAGQAPWWGTNAVSQFNIDQTWNADADGKLTLGVTAVPEPSTLLLFGSGIAIAAWKKKRVTATR